LYRDKIVSPLRAAQTRRPSIAFGALLVPVNLRPTMI
jgi:hypothetical protein